MSRIALLLAVSAACGRVGFDIGGSAPDGMTVGDARDDAGGLPTATLALGGGHTCTRTTTDGVRCWGDNAAGQLGRNSVANIGDDEPASAAVDVALGAPVLSIVAGYRHACALLDTGDVRCWGEGMAGQLGYGDTQNIGDDELVTVDVPLGGRAIGVASGPASRRTCAIIATGALRCWGEGGGVLGYGNTSAIGDDEPASAAGDVPLAPGNILQVVAGNSVTCVRIEGGTARCWGVGSRRGYGTSITIGDDEPASAAGDLPIGGSVVQLAAGESHTCALLDTGAVRCWGSIGSFLGYGTNVAIGDDEPASAAGDVPLGGIAVQITAGAYHTCARLDTGGLRCWGSNQFGQLGTGVTGTIGDDEPASSGGEVPVGGAIAEVVAGYYHTCARLVSGGLRCFGSNAQGALGYGHTMDIGDDETADSAGDVPY